MSTISINLSAAVFSAVEHLLFERYANISSTQAGPSSSSIQISNQLAHLQHSSLDDQLRAMHQLLTVRSPFYGALPEDVVGSIEQVLHVESEYDAAPLQPFNSLPTFTPDPSQPDNTLSFFHGDIARLHSPLSPASLAIINPANTAMLGCFQPTHKCLDNIIHSKAGPRLRQACYDEMQRLGRDELAVGEPMITEGYALEAGCVVHVAGPQLRRGAEPTERERKELREAYWNSLELARQNPEIKAVAFPCISTGLFSFPSDIASQIALRTCTDWLSSSGTTNFSIIFVLFSSTDVEHYSHAFSSLFPHHNAKMPIYQSPQIAHPIRDWIDNSAGLIIHAGAGLSIDAVHPETGFGLDYTSKKVFDGLYPALKGREGLESLYATMGYRFEDEFAEWGFRFAHGHTMTSWGPTPVYTSLLDLANRFPSYTVLTSNADSLFAQSGFDPTRVYTPQGSYANYQCAKPCRKDAYFPSAPIIREGIKHVDERTLRLAEDRADLIPKCQYCAGPVTYNVRGGSYFLEGPSQPSAERYFTQVADMLQHAEETGKHIVLLELGAGFNTPGVVRWRSEELAEEEEGKVKLIRVNAAHAEVPLELRLREDAVGLRMGAMGFLEQLQSNT